MVTTDNLEGSEEPKDKVLKESESYFDSKEVFSELSRYDLELCLFEILEKYQSSE